MTTRRYLICIALAASLCVAQEIKLPNSKDSLHFAILGDTGTGGKAQYQTGEQVVAFRRVFPFDLALMLGDNMYGGENPKDFVSKFERPYANLLSSGVKFYAALGNHDDVNQKDYKLFNMKGKRYYTFKPKDGIRFFALDSNYMDKEQLEWLEKELSSSGSDWKIAFFHHPLYSSGERHGPDQELRRVLEPLFLKYGVSVVFTGHEHFYERLKPQKGIHYFIAGGSAKLREGNIGRTEQTAVGFDTDNTFMLCEIDGDRMYFQTISRPGRTVDSGVITRVGATNERSRATSAAK
jgi:3',5'-cyclic AMP phosphodiesterase CpdA